jgi:hypothetical protein
MTPIEVRVKHPENQVEKWQDIDPSIVLLMSNDWSAAFENADIQRAVSALVSALFVHHELQIRWNYEGSSQDFHFTIND